MTEYKLCRKKKQIWDIVSLMGGERIKVCQTQAQ